MDIFEKLINAGVLFKVQEDQYQENLLLKGFIAPNTSTQFKVNVGNLGHFLCQEITGNFTTLAIDSGTALKDNGSCTLYGKLQDSTGQRQLFNDYISFDLWLSPGRTRVNPFLLPAPYTIAALGDPSNNLFYPTKFKYCFYANNEIILDLKNTSDGPNFFNINFHGVRIKTKEGGRNASA